MGSRKNILKNLGIPEYPWSSDDEETPTVPSGSTGGQQQQASTSTGGGATTSNGEARELIFSLLNQSTPINSANNFAPGTSNNRVDDTPLAYMSRATHTPAAELRELTSAGRDLDIHRVLAFKHITRSINNGRYSRFNFPRVPRQGVVEGDGSLRLPYFRRNSRNSVTNDVPPRQIVVDQSQQRSSSEPRRRRRSHSMEVQNTCEVDNGTNGIMAATTRSAEPVPEVEPIVIEPNSVTEAQASTSNRSGSGVALEEEIVVVEEEPAAVGMNLIDRVSAVLPGSSDPNLASTSREDEVDSPMTIQSNQSVKRKRRDSVEDKPANPFTVKQFNQSLLRLMECPVCLEWMEPPMAQCRRGHLVCNRCRGRLASCPVCRTTFSSVRNRAMEGVAEMLRYPCRHGCGREVRLRRRTPHEASCPSRLYQCPAPVCTDREPLPRSQLAAHFHSVHVHLVKMGTRHHFGIKVNSEAHNNWLILALEEFFHMKVDVDIRTWGVLVYVAYIGPKCNALNYTYQVTVEGKHCSRKLMYKRATHSDLESASLNVSRQDCFHLTLDQALNFIRFKNRHCDAEKYLEFDVEIGKVESVESRDGSDS